MYLRHHQRHHIRHFTRQTQLVDYLEQFHTVDVKYFTFAQKFALDKIIGVTDLLNYCVDNLKTNDGETLD